MRFKIDLASLIVGRKFTIFALFYFAFEGNFRVQAPVGAKKSAQRVGVLMRLRNLIPTQTKLQLYKAAVLPYLTYCHLIWHFCRASDSRRLEGIQERALRAIYCDKHSSYGQLLSIAGLMYSTQPATTGHSYSHV